MFCTWNVGGYVPSKISEKKNTKRKSIVFFGIGGILLHLWQRNQSLYSMLGGIAVRGSSYYSVTGVWWNYWNWRWTGTLCSGNLHWRNQYHASAFDGTFPVLSVCTGIAVHAQKKTKRHHSFLFRFCWQHISFC